MVAEFNKQPPPPFDPIFPPLIVQLLMVIVTDPEVSNTLYDVAVEVPPEPVLLIPASDKPVTGTVMVWLFPLIVIALLITTAEKPVDGAVVVKSFCISMISPVAELLIALVNPENVET